MYTTSLPRALKRVAITAGAVGFLTLAAPMAAQAHVTVQPGTAEGGSFSVVAFRVPTERNDASTTKLRVILPEDQPIGSVRTTPLPGWKVSTRTRTLAKPIDLFGEKLDSVVSEITWTATGTGIAPGQYLDFDANLGPLPASGSMTFKAVQTYSSGEKVAWNEVAADDSAEPEHPAPVLTLTPTGDDTATGGSDATATKQDGNASETRPVASQVDDESGSPVATVLASVALVVALGAAGMVWRRGRA